MSPFSVHAGTTVAPPTSSQVIYSSDADHKLSAKKATGYADQVQAMYVAYYSRPGDPGGVNYWAGRLASNGGDLSALINQFGNSAEYTERLAGKSSEQLVNNIFVSLFGRDADAGGLIFYKNKLESGAITLASIALNITNGVTTGSTDAAIINNKIEVASAYTSVIETQSAEYGENQIDDAVALLAGVTHEVGTSAAAIQGIDEALATHRPGAETPAVVETPTPEVVEEPAAEEEPAVEEEPAAEEEPVEAASKSINVSWSIPDSRENGDTLYSYEIGGYEILYKKQDETLYTSEIISDSQITSIDLDSLTIGEYEIKIASFDTDNLMSQYQVVSVSIN